MGRASQRRDERRFYFYCFVAGLVSFESRCVLLIIPGFFANQASGFLSRYAQALGVVSKVFGVALIALGIPVFTQQLSRIANFELLNKVLLK